ncbi:general substrate transporter [Basidiobolus meristosporus CBS 931.73]|uniref:General substrate transporter n=1 Tax=Basidiobolus meristosporus CBS 931.73 TaxID=1314790 RepID=A0A1Y1X0Z3_9FUNG|nr:general substrate transporter [Basidiobolus meristosporus CBS 931.73]|eukprot:ORX79278.1 general substrate transporter [Basidiobolus meristosporus CBS 931.73]
MGFYVYLTAAAAAIGGLLFGYDVGVISGVHVMPSFEQRFDTQGKALKVGFIVSSLVLGCFFGSFAASWLADRFGRRTSILIGGIVFTIGGALQASSFGVGQLIAGRIIAGLAVGLLSMVVPLYQSELAPKDIRGTLVSMQQLAITIGILISFLFGWGWKLESPTCHPMRGLVDPVHHHSVPPKIPRWLASQGRTEEALQVLRKVGNKPDEEMEDINEALRLEKEMGNPTWRELFGPLLRRRVIIGLAIQAFQQLTGINAVMYYAPTIFKSAGLDGTNSALIATAINGAVNVLFTIPAVLYVDRAGRRPLLLIGAGFMAIAMLIVGTLIAIYSPRNFDVIAAGYSSIAMIYLFVAFFAFTWGPIGWIYPSEIYPTRVRAKCMSLTTASNWTFNFIIGLVVPPLIESINWGVYVIFGACGVLMFIFVYFCVPETKGKSLEQIDHMFGGRLNLDEKNGA